MADAIDLALFAGKEVPNGTYFTGQLGDSVRAVLR